MDIKTIAINAAVLGINTLGTTVISVATNHVCNKKIVKSINADKYDDAEKYNKAVKKAKAKSSIISAAVTAASAVGLSCGSAYALGELNSSAPENTDSDQTQSDLI